MWRALLRLIDWFVPADRCRDRSELGMARVFIFTHLAGPLLAQSISLFLYLTDPQPGLAVWVLIVSIWSFWALPFVLKITGNLQMAALISVEVLSFASLFGSFHYGGVSSPLLPWLLIALLLGFFYLSDKPLLVLTLFTVNLLGFFGAYLIHGGFDQRVPLSALTAVGWISIVSATVYMSWMAIYYVSAIALRSDLEREAERHRKTAVRLLHAKEAAERANLSRSIFLAKMSHEFRTPLNAVIGYSELLLEHGLDAGAGKQEIEDLGRINAAGRHLLSLVTDVLDLERIESNSVEMSVTTFSLDGFINEVAATAGPLVNEKNNRLVIKSSPGLSDVATDVTKLRQVVLNLLSNAAKFTNGGTITLSCSRETRPGGDWFEIAVEDTGIGIEKHNLDKLFEEFRQATPHTYGAYGGTGLGLAVSQKLCALMGGGISVDSAPGRGSLFAVRLPAAIQPH
jgi:signal transduction histidine kinase